MLSLVGPNVAQGSISAPAAAYAEFILPKDTLVEAVLSSSALPLTIAQIRRVAASEPPEDRPPEVAVQRAVRLLEETHASAAIYLAASDIESFEGDLFIHWTSAKKRITIISPHQQNGSVRLYKKIGTEWSQLMLNPSPVDVASALKWVLQ